MSRARLSPRALVLLFSALLSVAVIVANLYGLVRKPSPPPVTCPPGRICGGPPPASQLEESRTWKSTELGFGFEYPSDFFQVAGEDGHSVRLQITGNRISAEVWVTGAPARDRHPRRLVEERLGALSSSIVGLAIDDQRATTILGPSIGYVDGLGGSYRGVVDTPQGPGNPAVLAVLGASDGRLSVVFSLVHVNATDFKLIQGVRSLAGEILKTFSWAPPQP